MIALYLNHAILESAASPTLLFQLFRKFFEFVGWQWNTCDQSHPFAFTSLGFPSDADDTVTRW